MFAVDERIPICPRKERRSAGSVVVSDADYQTHHKKEPGMPPSKRPRARKRRWDLELKAFFYVALPALLLACLVGLTAFVAETRASPASSRVGSRPEAGCTGTQEQVKWAQERMNQQYQTVNGEIRLRIENQQRLYYYRFAVLGAVLAFAAPTRELIRRWASGWASQVGAGRSIGLRSRFDMACLLLSLWVAALGSAILDLHLAQNDTTIRHLGRWVREHYETYCGVIPGWESAFNALENGVARWSCYGMTALILAVAYLLCWLIIRRRLVARRSAGLELAITWAGTVFTTVALAFGVWIQAGAR